MSIWLWPYTSIRLLRHQVFAAPSRLRRHEHCFPSTGTTSCEAHSPEESAPDSPATSFANLQDGFEQRNSSPYRREQGSFQLAAQQACLFAHRWVCYCIQSRSAADHNSADQDYQNLCDKLREISTLGGISGLLQWDEAVMMPAGAAESRGRQKSVLAGVVYEKVLCIFSEEQLTVATAVMQPRGTNMLAACHYAASV